jgi:hypothetical protein
MSPSRVILAIISAALVAAHFTGNMKGFLGAFAIDVDWRDLPYLLAIPAMGVFTLVMLRNRTQW